MGKAVCICLVCLAVFGVSAGLAAESEKLQIGSLAGLKRPDGFVVQDLRTEAMKTSSREETYRRPPPNPFQWSKGPFARYRNNVGDAQLNVSPVDLLAEKLIERYGDKLAGKKLVVREFSFIAQETIDQPQSFMVIPLDAASLGAAVVGSIVGTAVLQSGSGGRSSRIEVKIVAELDDKPFTGSDYLGIGRNSDKDIVARIVNGALDHAFRDFEQPKAEDLPERATRVEKTKPDVPTQVDTKEERASNESTESR